MVGRRAPIPPKFGGVLCGADHEDGICSKLPSDGMKVVCLQRCFVCKHLSKPYDSCCHLFSELDLKNGLIENEPQHAKATLRWESNPRLSLMKQEPPT